MAVKSLPILSLKDDAQPFADAIGASFRDFGFAIVCDHGIDEALIGEGWRLAKAFFALPEAEKRSYFINGLAGARGYTPFRTEIAKGASVHDLKEFWHVGRSLPDGSPLAASMPANVWPQQPAGFAETFTALFDAFDRTGATILARVAMHLGLADNWFDAVIEDGNSVMRLLHYPPQTGPDAAGAIRAAAHEDINLITLLLGAEEAGLELLDKSGEWFGFSPPPGAMVINIGDMLQRLTNNELPSTTHRVRNPDQSRTGYSRYSMPFFLNPRSDFLIQSLPQCVSAENPARSPVQITANEYLEERLREIGLRT